MEGEAPAITHIFQISKKKKVNKNTLLPPSTQRNYLMCKGYWKNFNSNVQLNPRLIWLRRRCRYWEAYSTSCHILLPLFCNWALSTQSPSCIVIDSMYFFVGANSFKCIVLFNPPDKSFIKLYLFVNHIF